MKNAARFSEDIDLILDWRVLGYGKDEPCEKRSNAKQDATYKTYFPLSYNMGVSASNESGHPFRYPDPRSAPCGFL